MHYIFCIVKVNPFRRKFFSDLPQISRLKKIFPSKTWNLKKSLFRLVRGCRATMSPAKLPPEPPDLQNGLLANQNQPRLCLTLHHRASTTLTPRLAFLSPITNIWLLHPQKAFFSKNLKMIKKFFREDHIVTMYYDLL